jgi:Transposase zinc-binding domain/Putative transposase
VADVFRDDGPAYQERFGAALLPSHRRAMADLIHGRTEALGGHLLPCDPCGQEHYAYHSCRNRRGPTCHRLETETWLEERRQALLPVPYVHVVFTVPQAWREILRCHQPDLDNILLRAAAQALITLAADPHEVGGLLGGLCGLHTWTRTLVYHPHVHGLVPAGGVSADRTEWRPARTSSWVPVHALAKLFRGLFLDLVRQERPALTLPEVVWTKGWVVSGTPTVQGPEPVLQSLDRDRPPDRADQSPSARDRGGTGLWPLPGRSDLSLADHDPPSPRVYPPLPAARVPPRLPQGPVRRAVASHPSSPPAPTPARAGGAHSCPPLPRLLNQRHRPLMPGVHPSARVNPVHPAARGCWSSCVPCPDSNGGHHERPSDLLACSPHACHHPVCRRVQPPRVSVSGEPS